MINKKNEVKNIILNLIEFGSMVNLSTDKTVNMGKEGNDYVMYVIDETHCKSELSNLEEVHEKLDEYVNYMPEAELDEEIHYWTMIAEIYQSETIYN